ncbi:DUF4783 domain-containing protein [Ilyomonas limi]|jgi:hypothetical protein|uniref:DUF4783 domain-containing protein n=1 Tax=Ilyomonas limi TaxID=2575867 RepID=A0A4U3L8Q3_9BACT|nr:DUF4783 domain-containing protein [Ilyomonas limi]TKK71691.1 DUF4783 domain-containing protein [Ilyomonas limi]
MKKILPLLLIGFSLMSFTLFQSGREEMITALKQGNAEQFIKYLDNTIDIKMPDSDEMKGVQKTEAANTLRSFFADNGITKFDVTSQRELGGTMYVTGKLIGTTDYNLTAMIKSSPDKLSIITLRVNK